MGSTNSKVEEDKALQLCRERKKYVGKALDGRCSLAATHFTYIESLTIIGGALRRFVEPEAAVQSSLYTSTSATPEPHAFSFSSTMSQHMNPAGTGVSSPSPSPPTSSRFYANHMKTRGSFSRKVEEKPPVPVIVSVTTSSTPITTTPRSIDEPETPFDHPPHDQPESQPWDYFGLPHPIDNEFSPHESSHVLEMYNDVQNIKTPTEGSVTYQESEDEFDGSDTDGLVRSFENVNRVVDNVSGVGLRSMSSAESMTPETEILNGEKGHSNSPRLSPLKRKTSGIKNVAILQEEKTEVVKQASENRPAPKDLISSMRDIEQLFIKASECGREVPRLLEANKLHFRPIFPGKERGSFTSKFLKACMACGEDPSQAQGEEPAQNDMKYLTWHRSTSSRASSFRHDPTTGNNTRENPEDASSSLYDNFCMNSGSHASTLDRLYAWEKKLYDEVKANEALRKVYDQKRKLLRELESTGESSRRIDKTRSIVKDLHWRIGVVIYRIDSISRRIEDLRDKELHPQLEELIEGLRKMWEVMHECHKTQFLIISATNKNTLTKISLQSDSHRHITAYLESELSTLSSSFTKWIGAQKTYVQSLNEWLKKCVSLQQSTKRRKRQPIQLKDYGPPIYVTCGVWLEKLETLPAKVVADSIKELAAEIDHFLPRQEKVKGGHRSMPWQHANNNDDHAGVNLLHEEVLEDRNANFDRLKSRLEVFLGQLSKFSGLSFEMFTDLQTAIKERKIIYARTHSKST
ncbi:uncharacterized protein LOC143593661 [Bidens hawaiensis]|uniref:uncharacterized protein LOC143593661 n=1 Tax=Bidens hawaiensis TaxID=980011 RepID=UPI00404B58FE